MLCTPLTPPFSREEKEVEFPKEKVEKKEQEPLSLPVATVARLVRAQEKWSLSGCCV